MKTGSSKKVYPLMKVDTPFFISCLRKKHVGFTVLYKKKYIMAPSSEKKKKKLCIGVRVGFKKAGCSEGILMIPHLFL